jgi:hypothetical protein
MVPLFAGALGEAVGAGFDGYALGCDDGLPDAAG